MFSGTTADAKTEQKHSTPSEQTIDHYAILKVARNADQNAIVKAFRTLSKQYHPDSLVRKNNNENDITKQENDQTSQQIQAAYEILSDPEKRQRYDQGEQWIVAMPVYSGTSTSTSTALIVAENKSLADTLKTLSGDEQYQLFKSNDSYALAGWDIYISEKKNNKTTTITFRYWQWIELATSNAKLTLAICQNFAAQTQLQSDEYECQQIAELAQKQLLACEFIINNKLSDCFSGIQLAQMATAHKKCTVAQQLEKNIKVIAYRDLVAINTSSPSIMQKSENIAGMLRAAFKTSDELYHFLSNSCAVILMAAWNDADDLQKKLTLQRWFYVACEPNHREFLISFCNKPENFNYLIDLQNSCPSTTADLAKADPTLGRALLEKLNTAVIDKLPPAELEKLIKIYSKDQNVLVIIENAERKSAAFERLREYKLTDLTQAFVNDLDVTALAGFNLYFLLNEKPPKLIIAIWEDKNLQKRLNQQHWIFLAENHREIAERICAESAYIKYLEDYQRTTPEIILTLAKKSKKACELIIQHVAPKFLSGETLTVCINLYDADILNLILSNPALRKNLREYVAAQRTLIMGSLKKGVASLSSASDEKDDDDAYQLGLHYLSQSKTPRFALQCFESALGKNNGASLRRAKHICAALLALAEELNVAQNNSTFKQQAYDFVQRWAFFYDLTDPIKALIEKQQFNSTDLPIRLKLANAAYIADVIWHNADLRTKLTPEEWLDIALSKPNIFTLFCLDAAYLPYIIKLAQHAELTLKEARANAPFYVLLLTNHFADFIAHRSYAQLMTLETTHAENKQVSEIFTTNVAYKNLLESFYTQTDVVIAYLQTVVITNDALYAFLKSKPDHIALAAWQVDLLKNQLQPQQWFEIMSAHGTDYLHKGMLAQAIKFFSIALATQEKKKGLPTAQSILQALMPMVIKPPSKTQQTTSLTLFGFNHTLPQARQNETQHEEKHSKRAEMPIIVSPDLHQDICEFVLDQASYFDLADPVKTLIEMGLANAEQIFLLAVQHCSEKILSMLIVNGFIDINQIYKNNDDNEDEDGFVEFEQKPINDSEIHVYGNEAILLFEYMTIKLTPTIFSDKLFDKNALFSLLLQKADITDDSLNCIKANIANGIAPRLLARLTKEISNNQSAKNKDIQAKVFRFIGAVNKLQKIQIRSLIKDPKENYTTDHEFINKGSKPNTYELIQHKHDGALAWRLYYIDYEIQRQEIYCELLNLLLEGKYNVNDLSQDDTYQLKLMIVMSKRHGLKNYRLELFEQLNFILKSEVIKKCFSQEEISQIEEKIVMHKQQHPKNNFMALFDQLASMLKNSNIKKHFPKDVIYQIKQMIAMNQRIQPKNECIALFNQLESMLKNKNTPKDAISQIEQLIVMSQRAQPKKDCIELTDFSKASLSSTPAFRL